MLSKTTTGLHQTADQPPAPYARAIADNIAREALFRHLRTHRFEAALAILNSHPDLIRAVDENGADAVRYAVIANNAVAVRQLAVRGFDLDRKDKNGWSHTMEAAHLGLAGVLRVLIGHGADMNAKTQLGWTPVQLALLQGHSNAATVLIMAGANLHDGPMEGLHAPDLVEGVALDPEVAQLVLKKANQADPGCCGNCQGNGGCEKRHPHGVTRQHTRGHHGTVLRKMRSII